MTKTYTVTLTCGSCKAALTFTDERPDWKTYDYRVEQADECERSARFVVENADKTFTNHYTELNHAYRAAGHPAFVKPYDHDASPWDDRANGLCLKIPDPYRYVDCPVCDAQIKEPGRA